MVLISYWNLFFQGSSFEVVQYVIGTVDSKILCPFLLL